jgi:hypothetical protein
LRLLPTQPANNPSPEEEKQLKTNPPKNAIATLLLFRQNNPSSFLFHIQSATQGSVLQNIQL